MQLAILFLVLVALAFIGLRYRLRNTPDKRNLAASIDTEVHKAMKGGRLTGLVIGVFKQGRIFVKGYGTVDQASPRCPDAQTVFQIGSVSKLFTASLLQALCSEGRVSLDANLAELLSADMPLAPSARAITLRQLVTHTSGLPRVPKALEEKVLQRGGPDPLLDPYSHISREEVWDYLATAEGQKKPGRFDYSNYGMGLLAQVLERLTGSDYEALVRDKILAPLGMNSTAIEIHAELKAALAQGYSAKGQPMPPWTFTALGGAGAFSSTAADMLKFIQASLDAGSPAAQRFQAMRKPQVQGVAGLGWMQATPLDRFFGLADLVWHNGMVGGYSSYLSIDPNKQSGLLILCNQASGTDMLGLMLNHQIRTQSWASPQSGAALEP